MPDYPDRQKQVSWEFPSDPSSYIASSGAISIGATPQVLYAWQVANTGLYILQRLQVRGVLYDGELNTSRHPWLDVTLERGLDAKSPSYAIDGAGYYFQSIASGVQVTPVISIGTQDTPLLVRGSDGTTANSLSFSIFRDNSTGIFSACYYSLLMWAIG